MSSSTASAKRHLNKDPLFKAAMKGIKPIAMTPAGNVFNELVRAIAYQQISYKAAHTIYGRFEQLVGTDFTPEDLLSRTFEEFREIGFSTQKANYTHNIAEFFKEKKLLYFDWDTLSDKEIMDLLTEIKGVGRWTVQMILMFELHRPDVFPAKDLAIQQSIMEIYGFIAEKKALLQKMEEIAAAWQPHRTLASLYLWGWKRAHS